MQNKQKCLIINIQSIWKHYIFSRKQKLWTLQLKNPYFKYFILPSISESPNNHEQRLLVQDTGKDPPKHKQVWTGQPNHSGSEFKKLHVFHSSTRVDWLSTKVCIFPQCHFLWPYMHGNLCSEKTKVFFYNCSIILQHNFHLFVFCHIQHNHMFLTKMHSKDQRLRNSWNMNDMNTEI